MQCEEVRPRLDAYVDGEVTEAERAELRDHLARCGDCGPEAIDARRGLLDDDVLDLTVDPRGRVWTLTQKGISIIEP